MNIWISDSFESGNIQILDLSDSKNLKLAIRKDTCSDFLQWFHFTVGGLDGSETILEIINAKDTTYASGWSGYRACGSLDLKTWFRLPTLYVDGVLRIDLSGLEGQLRIAYFAPYLEHMHQELLHQVSMSGQAQVSVIAKSVQNRELHLLTFGSSGPESRKIVVIGRQHPGETMAQWFIDGLVQRLLDTEDALSRKLLTQACFYIVPNMNPDGSVLGNLRANAAGVNLNREWLNPDPEKSPEVFHVRQFLTDLKPDFFLDVHGDEVLPYNFFMACEGIPSYTDKRADLEEKFAHFYAQANPDFQYVQGYTKVLPSQADLSMASNWVAEYLGSLSLTLEMPFKDNQDYPDEMQGWSPGRCLRLGASLLDPIARILPLL